MMCETSFLIIEMGLLSNMHQAVIYLYDIYIDMFSLYYETLLSYTQTHIELLIDFAQNRVNCDDVDDLLMIEYMHMPTLFIRYSMLETVLTCVGV